MQTVDKQKLNVLWEEYMKGAFENFVDMNIGRDAKGRPSCFGSGDGERYCPYCPYVAIC